MTVRGDSRGHFQVEGSVDGRRIDFMVDTGASVVALRERDAGKARHLSGRARLHRRAPARRMASSAPRRSDLTSLEISGIRVYDVRAMVLPDKALSENLLGMSFLSRVRRFEMANGRLVMEQ